jgi:hypothetical protein
LDKFNERIQLQIGSLVCQLTQATLQIETLAAENAALRARLTPPESVKE